MDPNEVKPPDMAGAGVQSPTYPAQDAVGLLKSYGSLPAGLLQGPPGPQPGPSAGLSGLPAGLLQQPQANPYAAAVSAGMPFVGLPDQVARQQQQARLNQGQGFEQAMQMKAMQQRNEEKAYRRQQDQLTIYQHFLESDNDAARAFGAQGVGSTLKQMGVPVPQAVLEGLATKTLSLKTVDEITQKMAEGWSPDRLRAFYKNVPDQVFADAAKIVADPTDALAKRLGLKTKEERDRSALETKKKALENWAEERGIDVKSDVFSEMVRSSKKPIQELTDSELQALKGVAEQRVSDKKITDSLAKIAGEEAIKHRNRMAEIQERESLRAASKPQLTPALRAQSIKLQSEYSGFEARDQRLQRVKDAVALLDKEGLLPTGPTMIDFGVAAAKGGSKVNRPDIAAAWDTLSRYGVPMIANAEKELAGQPIGNMLRLKSIAESEIGGIRRIPGMWWKDFFQDYDAGVKARKELISQQLDAMGAEVPKSAPKAGGKALTPEQYKTIRSRGYSDEEIRKKGYEIPR